MLLSCRYVCMYMCLHSHFCILCTVLHDTCGVFLCVCVFRLVYLIFWLRVSSSLSDSSMHVHPLSHPIKTSFPRGFACLCVCSRSQSGSAAEPSGTSRRPKPSVKYLLQHKLRSEKEQKAAALLCWSSSDNFLFTLFQPHREVIVKVSGKHRWSKQSLSVLCEEMSEEQMVVVTESWTLIIKCDDSVTYYTNYRWIVTTLWKMCLFTVFAEKNFRYLEILLLCLYTKYWGTSDN